MYEMAYLKLTNIIKLKFAFSFTIFQVNDLVMFTFFILKQIEELIVVVRLEFLITFLEQEENGKYNCSTEFLCLDL